MIDVNEGWAVELRQYLKEMLADVMKDTNIVQWWQVYSFLILQSSILLILLQDHSQLYPTLTSIAIFGLFLWSASEW